MLKLQIAEFDKRILALDDVQKQVEDAIEKEDELEVDIGEAYDFRSTLMNTKIQAVTKLATLAQQNTNVNHTDTGPNTSNAKLPKLDIKKFSGDITEWQTFWDQFKAAVDSTTLPKGNKFTYLTNLLEGEALNSIVGLSLTDTNYDITLKSLQDRFGCPERIIFSHIQGLLNMDTGLDQSSKASELWTIRDKLNAHVCSLDALRVNGEKYGVILTPLILSRLPSEIRLEWARTGTGQGSISNIFVGSLKLNVVNAQKALQIPPTVEECHDLVRYQRWRHQLYLIRRSLPSVFFATKPTINLDSVVS
ncbi:hypothetical protein HOLleu_13566 [Holothuria leucospilota]|uniref:Uncharacterized protein n=1 Tax=Holothuria leucospilota TaxID=206669 RepID=A0A9Q1CC08_HOLLE|nr:hypothetical protein HOLleu_13566 [Holothuria leucospilota]